MVLALLHLCDSLFPIGAFGYSDGLEAAASEVRLKDVRLKDVRLKPDTTYETYELLREWIDVMLDENIGRLEGPAVLRAWDAFHARDWDALAAVDEELTALRPAASARQSSRAMGLRLLTTWQTLHPDERLAHARRLAERGAIGPTLPVAFAGACVCSGAGTVDRRDAVGAFAYTRLAATVSAALRLISIGQRDAHALLAGTLERVPAVVDAIVASDGKLESFTPAMDLAAMSQQYLHSRLFRS